MVDRPWYKVSHILMTEEVEWHGFVFSLLSKSAMRGNLQHVPYVIPNFSKYTLGMLIFSWQSPGDKKLHNALVADEEIRERRLKFNSKF